MASAISAAVATGCGGASAATVATSANLFYTDVGTGTNVMFVHGWTCDSHDWSWQLPAFESKFRVIALDLRGHGRSQSMPTGSYMPADYVSDLETFIATKYPGQKFTIVGHSMGGQIAARLAVRRPDLVKAVVSVDGSLGFAEAFAPIFQKTVDNLNSGDPGVVGPALFQQFYDAATPAPNKRWHARRLQGTPVSVVRESFGPLFLGADQVGVGAKSEAFCKTVTVPMYHLCRDASQAEAMRSWFSNSKSKVELWRDAGHWIMQDRVDDFNASVTEWIEAL